MNWENMKATKITPPAHAEVAEELGRRAERKAFENWFKASPAKSWYASDAAYAAWCAAAESARGRCAQQCESLGYHEMAHCLRTYTVSPPKDLT